MAQKKVTPPAQIYLTEHSSTGGDTPAYELLLLGWLACAAVGSVLGVALRGVMRRNVAWRIGRAMCVAFLALFVAMAAVLLVFLTTFAG